MNKGVCVWGGYGRIMPDGSYTPTTWQVQFELPEVITHGFYKLLMATTSSSTAAIHVRCLSLCISQLALKDYSTLKGPRDPFHALRCHMEEYKFTFFSPKFPKITLSKMITLIICVILIRAYIYVK